MVMPEEELRCDPAQAGLDIQAKLNQAKSGQTVTIAPGTFIIETPLTIPDGVTLQGSGVAETRLKTPRDQPVVKLYLPFSSSGDTFLFYLLSKLYERTSVVITTNLSFSDWDQVFGDAR